ncbi:MAG: GNAT family N-acetyltransferase [Bacteroidia bacterium]|nr:GNAT family N-acetyltransferase [Bacteroidia bacterium]
MKPRFNTLDHEVVHYSPTEIDSLIERFEQQQLPRVEWTHEAHLVVAIWYCYHHPDAKALDLVRGFITNHNTSVGTPNTDTEGYHETITWFWLQIARKFIDKHDDFSIYELCNAFIDSKYASSKYPLEYYTEGVLFSVKARHEALMPDQKPLSKGILIRPIEPGDTGAITVLSKELGYELQIGKVASHIEAILASDHHYAFVATRNSRVVGFIHAFETLRLISSPFVEIGSIVIRESERGLGLGRLLVHYVEETVAKGNHVRVRCNTKRERAHGFYRSLGYTENKVQTVFDKTPQSPPS